MGRTSDYSKSLNRDYERMANNNDKLKKDKKMLELKLKVSESENQRKDKLIAEKDNEIDALKKELIEIAKKLQLTEYERDQYLAKLNIDGTNAGIPTSQTPINKKKIIPNTRTKSDKKIGGQLGHKKHKLEKFNDEEINDNVNFELENCPCCGGELTETGEICKDELSYRFVPIKRRNHFITYKCNCCEKEVHKNIPNRLKEDNQYGSEIQTVALSLANEGNVSMNKIRHIIRGFSHEEIDMSEGYIAKLQKKASEKLVTFKEDLYKKILTCKLLYWDDTVIMINAKRGCLRFYGDKSIAYYTAHNHKNEDGIKEDGILNTLSKNVTVMHDHNIINYKYSYQNIECNVHLIRDLEKCKNNTCHEWCDKFKLLVQKIIHDRNELINTNEHVASFDIEYINDFDAQYEDILYNAIEENLSKKKTHYDKDERALINRILEYKDNYFIWMYDFSLPIDDNLSERGLRGAKSKMKIAGQFQNEKTAKYYADIKTYIETCYRNKINPTDALIRLMEDNPYTVEEIFGKQND